MKFMAMHRLRKKLICRRTDKYYNVTKEAMLNIPP